MHPDQLEVPLTAALDPPPTLREIVPGPEPLEPRPRAIYVAKGTAIDVENADGSQVNGVKVFPSRMLPFVAHKITAGLCTHLIGLY